MKIRRLATGDYEEITRIWSRAGLPFRPKGRDSKKAIAAEIAANPDFVIGAFEGDRLIGVAVLSSDTRKGWINRLAVDPDYRHCGVAKRLVEESEKTLRRHGLRLFGVLINEDNTASRSLFKKCGYTEHHDIFYFSKRDDEEI
jgi:ribosomal protein S18 acetylase RimI-like enzyme